MKEGWASGCGTADTVEDPGLISENSIRVFPNCIVKTKIKKKTGNGPFLKKIKTLILAPSEIDDIKSKQTLLSDFYCSKRFKRVVVIISKYTSNF